MGRELESLGVEPSDIYLEGYSDDTLGNAFFARVMHADARSSWRRILVITSEFQMERTKAIYDWVFGLAPWAGAARKYELRYDAVDDVGALPARALRSRRSREASSLRAFLDGPLPKMRLLDDVHRWINTRHSGYTFGGQLGKKPFDKSAAGLAQSY